MKENKAYRVLILPSWYLPDGGTFFHDHALGLQNQDFEVHILANRTISLTGNSFKEIIGIPSRSESIEDGVFVSRRSTFKFPKLKEWNMKRWVNSYMSHFEKYTEKHGLPNIIIVHSSIWAGVVAKKLKEKYKIPYILVEHRGRFTEHLDLTSDYFEDWYLNYIKEAFSAADRLVCVSDALKNKISRISGKAVQEILTIPNMVDTEFFCPTGRTRESQPFVFLSAGFFDRIKGFDILLGAFSHFLDQNEGEFFLRIAGKGKDEKQLKKYAEDLGIAQRVSFIGHVSRERLRDEMQRSNVFVLPSRFESFGVVLIEALATACPVIATQSGGPISIVNDKNGFLVEVENEHALTDAMERIYMSYLNFNPEIIQSEAIEKYSSETISDKYRHLIREILHEYSTTSS